jgi:hypothetical protein
LLSGLRAPAGRRQPADRAQSTCSFAGRIATALQRLIPVPLQRWHLTTLFPFFKVPLPSQFLHICFFGAAVFGISSSEINGTFDQERSSRLDAGNLFHAGPRLAPSLPDVFATWGRACISASLSATNRCSRR